ncbi:MAG TPA: four helix bundle protein [Candidatus Absconditabacterales bacterium]|nr:four helix bundle protein [Candidatus Absconditabacterales bacterium]
MIENTLFGTITKMGNVEDLKVWDSSIKLAKNIYFLIKDNPNIQRDFGLKEQLQKSAISVASNIAEGCNRGTDKEFIRFLYIARGSCSELKTQLIISKEIAYIEKTICDKLCADIDNINKMINGLIQKLSKH